MNINFRAHQWKIIIAGLLGVSTLAYCAPFGWFGSDKIDFELTGQVLDFDTKQPIEGAYVIADYQKVDLGFGGTARYCVKTKGMYTGKDGQFHFPIDKLDGNSPYLVHAIKPDYFLRDWVNHLPKVQEAQGKEAYTNRHIYLKRQDAAKPEFRYGFRDCRRPESSEAIEAAVQYMQIEIDEETKYGKDIRSVNAARELMQSMKEKAEKQIYKKKQ
jgi:hypothetical protein